jgi:hypothetical protein
MTPPRERDTGATQAHTDARRLTTPPARDYPQLQRHTHTHAHTLLDGKRLHFRTRRISVTITSYSPVREPGAGRGSACAIGRCVWCIRGPGDIPPRHAQSIHAGAAVSVRVTPGVHVRAGVRVGRVCSREFGQRSDWWVVSPALRPPLRAPAVQKPTPTCPRRRSTWAGAYSLTTAVSLRFGVVTGG